MNSLTRHSGAYAKRIQHLTGQQPNTAGAVPSPLAAKKKTKEGFSPREEQHVQI